MSTMPLPPLLERFSLLPPLPEAELLPEAGQFRLLPHQPLLHPTVTEQNLRQQHYQHDHYRHQYQHQQRRESTQQQQRRRDRQNSLSDVSSIGENDQALVDEVVAVAQASLPQPQEQLINPLQEPISGKHRLGKIFPVKETEGNSNNANLEGHMYRPPIDHYQHRQNQHPQIRQHHQVQHQRQDQNQNRNDRLPPFFSMESFDIPSPAPPPATPAMELPPHPDSVLATTATLARHFSMASLHSQQRPQQPQAFPLPPQQYPQARQTPAYPIERLQIPKLPPPPTNQQQQQQQQQQHVLTKRKRNRSRQFQKEVLFLKLHRVITEIGLRRESNRSTTDTANTNDGNSSIVSSLSSSSSSGGDGFEGDELDDDNIIPQTTKRQHHNPNGTFVSVTFHTASVTQGTEEDDDEEMVQDDDDAEEDPWIFDRFPIPRNLRLQYRSQAPHGPPGKHQEHKLTTPATEGGSCGDSCSCGSSTDSLWGIYYEKYPKKRKG
jgi:hypothetical protein